MLSRWSAVTYVAGVALAWWATPLRAQLETPGHWRWVTDAPAQVVTQQDVPEGGWRFVAMPPGWHVTMGPGGILYDPAYGAAGRYALEAETFLFPGESTAGFGLFVGGRNLEQADRDYVAFVIRKDGSAAVTRHAGGAMTPLAEWRPVEGVVPHTGGTARNVLRVTIERDSVLFEVNGSRAAALPRTAATFDGRFGFRVGSGVNLHISTLDFTQRIAPPRGQ